MLSVCRLSAVLSVIIVLGRLVPLINVAGRLNVVLFLVTICVRLILLAGCNMLVVAVNASSIIDRLLVVWILMK